MSTVPGLCQETFHNGGTGDCKECHSTPPALLGTDASSTCLRCHQAEIGIMPGRQHQVATDTATYPLCVQLSPGGDFCWLKKNYTWDLAGMREAQGSAGDSHGHNIVAVDYGFAPDSSFSFAPGGTYPAASLSCVSCHDPHGNYRRLEDNTVTTSGPPVIASGSYADSPAPGPRGSVGVYRLLAGKGYQPKSMPGVPVFDVDPPVAVSPSQYNRAETSSDTRVVYGSGMSEWCQNCHPQFDSFCRHPVGSGAVLNTEIVNNYNRYISSGNLKGDHSFSYTSLVPYEVGVKDYAMLKTLAITLGRSGPGGGVNVMCLSCHRAHASGWDSMLRWNMQAEFIIYDGVYPGIDNDTPPQYAQGRTAAETQKTFYDRLAGSFATFQRSFCNKCHVQD
ncbi:cytochrome C [Thiovibrio sp. JS02]